MNSLDKLARAYDIVYENSNPLSYRYRADDILKNQAWEIFK